MSIKIDRHDRIVYVHNPGDGHSIVWFGDLRNEHDHSLYLGETIKVIGIDLLGVDEI